MPAKEQNKTKRHRFGQIDKLIGERIRMRRILLHYTQQRLGYLMGLTFQQIQKYEKGINCISAGRLWNLAQVLNVSPSYFFQDLMKENAAKNIFIEENSVIDKDPLERLESLNLLQNYYKLNNRQIAKQIFDLLDKIANQKTKSKQAKK